MEKKKPITLEDRIKGHIAEGLVAQLFTEAGIPFMRFGFEHQLLDFTKRSGGYGFQSNETSERLRLAPDFLIRNKTGNLELVEVKYCQQGRPHNDKEVSELKKLAVYWSATLVVVSYNTNPLYKIPYYQVVHPDYETDSQRNFVNSHSIQDEKSWGIQQEVVTRLCLLVEQLYDPFTIWDKQNHKGAPK